ncbi:MAG: flagellar hook-length control protein FliK [Spirochaetales bacterium]|nr:flagellar hook-length control protein FliK [Spirochaetales bacterium]
MYTLTPVVTRPDRPSPIPDRTAKAESSGSPDPFSDYLRARDASGEDVASRSEHEPSEPETPSKATTHRADTGPTQRDPEPIGEDRVEGSDVHGDDVPSEAGRAYGTGAATKGAVDDTKRPNRGGGGGEGEASDSAVAVDIEAQEDAAALDVPIHHAPTETPDGAVGAKGHVVHGAEGAVPEQEANVGDAKTRRIPTRDGSAVPRVARGKGRVEPEHGASEPEAGKVADDPEDGLADAAEKLSTGKRPREGRSHFNEGATDDGVAPHSMGVIGREVGTVEAIQAHPAAFEAVGGKPTLRKGVVREGSPVRIDSKVERASSPESASLKTRDGVDIIREIQVDLSESSSQGEGNDPGAARDGETFGAPLRGENAAVGRSTAANGGALASATGNFARRLNGELGTRIVRDARIMLQNADSAEIRLIIRPPELGRVRIRLRMDNGHIAGRILVDNGNVREVMEQNLASLQRAFEEAGLDIGDLEVSTGDDGRQTRDGESGFVDTQRGRRRVGAERFEQHVAPAGEYDYGTHRVNLVA